MIHVRDAIQYMVQYEELVLPHEFHNLPYEPFRHNQISEAEWNAFTWNPMDGSGHMTADPAASPKPTYEDLQNAIHASKVTYYQQNVSAGGMKSFVRDYISRTAYGTESLDDELYIKQRLQGTEILVKMNNYKEHIRNRYHEIKHYLLSIPKNETGAAIVDALNAKGSYADESLYTAARWTPAGAADPYNTHHGIPEYVYHDPGHPPFVIELTLETPITNDNGRQVAALHIFGSAKADYNLTYPTGVSVHLEKDLAGSPITQLSSARPRAGVTTVWIARRAGASTERELAAEISVFASPYGELKGAKTTVTFPAVPVAPPGG